MATATDISTSAMFPTFEPDLGGGNNFGAGAATLDVPTLEVIDPRSVDSTPPIISNVSPSPPGPITRTASISFDVTEEREVPPLASVIVQVVYGSGASEVVHDGTSFVAPYTGTRTPILRGYSYTISATGEGWKHASTTIRITAVDGSGNVSSATEAYTISNPPAAPVLANFSPAVLSSITRTASISFDATDATGFERIVVQAQRGSGKVEVIHDGIAFRSPFAGTRTPITDGYTYSFTRTGYGWPEASLVIRIFAIDANGNESGTTDFSYTVTNPLNPEETVQNYKMRALADPGPGYLVWVVQGTPDFAGTYASGPIQAGTAVVADFWVG